LPVAERAEEQRGAPDTTYAGWSKANRLRALDERAALARRELAAVDGGSKDPATIQRRELLEKKLEIALLEMEIAEKEEVFNARPRRAFVGARSDSPAIRSYLASWSTYLENIGTKNMIPGLRGKVQLTMAIRPNGALETVEINKSSGNVSLDQSALRIARLAAPYPRFVAGMESIDILHIARTWSFEERRGAEVSNLEP
jgi:TonB family protein